MIGNCRETDGSEKNRVMVADLVQAVVRHHPAGTREVIATPGQLVILEMNAFLSGNGVEYAQSFRHNFLADSVSRYDGNPVPGCGCHASKLSKSANSAGGH